MDFRRLEIFFTVVREGNFSRAAKYLHLTQPAISSQLEKLEGELGTKLFDRRSREAVLTDAGKRFLPYAREILDLKEKGTRELKKFRGEIAGNVKISASSTPGNYILPRFLGDFLNQYPRVCFQVLFNNTDETLEKINNYKADLGFIGSIKNHQNLKYHLIFEDEMVFIASPMSSLPDQINFSDIINFPLILRSGGSATQKIFNNQLKKANINTAGLQIRASVDTLEGVKNCVRQGAGMGIVPKISLAGENGLKQIKIADITLKRSFYLVYHRNSFLSPAAEKIIEKLLAGGKENAEDLS